jgi:CubicO group peptidase (beta-lactamase class C family)
MGCQRESEVRHPLRDALEGAWDPFKHRGWMVAGDGNSDGERELWRAQHIGHDFGSAAVFFCGEYAGFAVMLLRGGDAPLSSFWFGRLSAGEGLGRQNTCRGMRLPVCLALSACLLLSHLAFADEPKLRGIGAAMEAMVAKNEIAGAVTVVVTKDKTLHLESTGLADVAAKKPMTPDTMFWIASMTKPITGAAVLMLQDEGKLNVSDPVAKYLPEFANLKTPSGKPANLTIAQLLTHTSGLGEARGPEAKQAKTLADLVPLWLATPMQYEPGAKWSYTQSGINAAGRVVEVVSGMSFDAFLQQRLFDPLGMKDTTFYPTEAQRARMVTAYAKNKETGALTPVPPREDFGRRERPPQGNGGLFSTAPDYARFCQMLLGGGSLEGRRYLSAEAMKFLATPQTGELPTGFFQNATYGNRGVNYGWGLGTSILRAPHDGVAAMLSAGSFGHGGAWGTQAWVDPVKGVGYVLMVQRANFPNSDASDVRRAFQQAAVDALGK